MTDQLQAHEGITQEELQLAARNHGMPLEALRWDVTPVGLHYLLTHYDIPLVDAAQWRLELGGHVQRGAALTLHEVRARPAITAPVVLECAGNGRARLEPRPRSQPWLLEAVGQGEWTGTPLRPLLEEAGPRDGALEVVFTGADRGVEGGVEQPYQRALPLAAIGKDVLLAYELNGAPLPPQHGFPLRLLVPGWYGMTSVKWLRAITVIDHAFDGYQNARAYRWRTDPDDAGTPLSRIAVRSLMVPPGVPEYFSRRRHVRPGRHVVQGRAWSGHAAISMVELSADGGATWNAADLEPQRSPSAWQRWTAAWVAEPGEHELCCRATDRARNIQPLEPVWNVGGYANNAVQRVPVLVAT